MKTNKIFLFGLFFLFFNLLSDIAFAATGNARDGQLFFLFLITLLLLLLGIQALVPILVHWIRDQWKRVHHC
jgi:hypothetical protein